MFACAARVLCLLSLILASDAALAGYVTIRATGLLRVGPSLTLAVDLVHGGEESANKARLERFHTDGVASLSDGSAPNAQSTLALNSHGARATLRLSVEGASALAFSLHFTDQAPLPETFPDTLAVFLLDASGDLPALETDDPTGAQALLRIDLDGSQHGSWSLFTAQEPHTDASWQVTAGMPLGEPAPLALFAGSLLAAALAWASSRHRVISPLRLINKQGHHANYKDERFTPGDTTCRHGRDDWRRLRMHFSRSA